jgi:basic membrane protein A
MGGVAVPAVVRFGHGFIQGADHAAAFLGLSAGDVTIRYHYVGGFAPDPAVTTQAGSWYATGTEVIFAAAGGAGFSVIAAAEAAGTSVIGVDVDQADASHVVVTSAIKGLATSVYDMLTDFMNGTWRGGRELMFDATVNGIGLPMESLRMNNFSQAQYDAIFNQLATGAVTVNDSLEISDILAAVSLVSVDH